MYKVAVTDTDSIKIARIDGLPMSEEEMDSLLKKMNDATPKLINLEMDGYYPRFLVIKSKNYVTDDGKKIKYRGSSLMDTKKEPALKEFMIKIINSIMDEKDTDYLVSIYNQYIKEALDIKDINRWATKKTITKALFDSERKNETKVVDAIKGFPVQEGDKIWVYEAIGQLVQKVEKGEPQFYKDGRPKMVQNKTLKLIQNWTGDHDPIHYVGRVYSTLCILSNVIDINAFTDYTLKKNQTLLQDL